MRPPRILALTVLILALSCKGSGTPPAAAAPSSVPPTVVFPDGFAVQVELATTPEQQTLGLMYVEDLPPDRGMLFLFPTDEPRGFWMKNCKIPIDMVWLDADYRVVDITRSAPPCTADPCPTYSPSFPCRNVLEVGGGVSAAHPLEAGDRLVVAGLP